MIATDATDATNATDAIEGSDDGRRDRAHVERELH